MAGTDLEFSKASAVLVEPRSQRSSIHSLGEYHSYRRGRNARFDVHSRRILDLKDGNDDAIAYFAGAIDEQVENDLAVAVVPPHAPGAPDSGILRVARMLCARNRTLRDVTRCLMRERPIDKLAVGGKRSLRVHLESIAVKNPALIENTDVLVLDDVTTTGNSLWATERLLLNAGARSVALMAMGRTADPRKCLNANLQFAP
jgi:predicted amidophosphoribosyltransferase